ncbi:pentapeptide repeat-containing protein [Streptomyces sp. NPDC048650]|uniref:pentapeptide repeat-containing protein n=1 Tax=Streptomyces sp. NPDC048650 TaxID=3365583 RepID=UPI00372486C7
MCGRVGAAVAVTLGAVVGVALPAAEFTNAVFTNAVCTNAVFTKAVFTKAPRRIAWRNTGG